MCRSVEHGGRRCPFTEAKRARHNQIQKESYARRKARAAAKARTIELAAHGITVTTEHNTPLGWRANIATDLADVATTADPTRDDHWVPEGSLTTHTATDPDEIVPSPAEGDHPGGQIAPAEEPTPDSATHELGAPVRPHAGALIAQVDNKQDHDALARRYPHPTTPGRVSFEAMRRDGIHGVRLTANGHRDVGGSRGPFAGWTPGMMLLLVGFAFVVATDEWQKKARRPRRR